MATILIVDDHVLNRQFLLALLGFEQHRLLAAADGIDGLALARSERPDLIITDILMPRMDGYHFIKALRAEREIAATPVIFYTSTYSTPEAQRLARECRVRWVLQKPAVPELILRTVQEAISAEQAELALSGGGAGAVQARDPALASCLRQAESQSHLYGQISELDQPDGGAGRRLGDTGAYLNSSLSELQAVSLRLSALIDMGIDMAREREPRALLAHACTVARHISVASYAAVGIVSDDGASLRHLACEGLERAAEAYLASLPPGAGVLGALLEQRLPQRGGQSGPLPAMQSFLALPVATAERCYGWIYLANKLGADQFSEIDERAAATVASQLAVAYENLLLFGKVEAGMSALETELNERLRVSARLQQSERELRERAAGLQRAQQVAGLAHVVSGPDGSFESVSATLAPLLGLAPADLPASTREWLALVLPADRERLRQACIGAGRDGRRTDVEYRLRRSDGALISIHQVLEPLEGERGGRWFTTLQDVTAEKEQQARLTHLGQLYAVLSGINSAIVRIRDRDELLQEACRVAVSQGAFGAAWAGVLDSGSGQGRVVAWNGFPADYAAQIEFSGDPTAPSACRPASVAVREQRLVVCNDIATELPATPMRAQMLAAGLGALAVLPLMLDQRCCAVLALFASDAGFFRQEGRMALLDELAGDLAFGLQGIDRDERLQYLAYYDVLTGLPNAMLFQDRLSQLLLGANAEGEVAVIAFNVDHFSQINDAYGRHAGDAILRQMAALLSGRLDESCTVSRLGGDNFAVALGAPDGVGADALALVEQLLAALERPLQVGQQDIVVTVRAGIALYPSDGGDAETLLRHAEVALKKAKADGQRSLFYGPEFNRAVCARLALEKALRQGLQLGQFCMHYQPRIDLRNGRLVSAEALIRWNHPERGLLAPGEFIELAEQCGLIVPLGDWIIEHVCAQQADWRAHGVPLVPVAINLSALQFRHGKICHTIGAAIARHRLAPREMEFELTESVVMAEPERATVALQELKTLGVQLSLDDFGTGYSSLAYLKRFPFDVVKIDRSFVTDVCDSAEDAAIATAIIAMAHSLGLRVVAEGVETEAQLQFLRGQRCDEFQGYLFSPAVPAQQFAAMLEQGRGLALTDMAAKRRRSSD